MSAGAQAECGFCTRGRWHNPRTNQRELCPYCDGSGYVARAEERVADLDARATQNRRSEHEERRAGDAEIERLRRFILYDLAPGTPGRDEAWLQEITRGI